MSVYLSVCIQSLYSMRLGCGMWLCGNCCVWLWVCRRARAARERARDGADRTPRDATAHQLCAHLFVCLSISLSTATQAGGGRCSCRWHTSCTNSNNVRCMPPNEGYRGRAHMLSTVLFIRIRWPSHAARRDSESGWLPI